MPTSPGRHGAKLTLFMPETSEMDDFNLMGPAALLSSEKGVATSTSELTDSQDTLTG